MKKNLLQAIFFALLSQNVIGGNDEQVNVGNAMNKIITQHVGKEDIKNWAGLRLINNNEISFIKGFEQENGPKSLVFNLLVNTESNTKKCNVYLFNNNDEEPKNLSNKFGNGEKETIEQELRNVCKAYIKKIVATDKNLPVDLKQFIKS